MIVFVKFGGSVITDKTGEETPDRSTIALLAADLRDALESTPNLQLILGHGSGSFGHVYARRYGIHNGLGPHDDWMGFARTAGAALRLNRIVVDELLAAGVPALTFQPSATLRSSSGVLDHWDTSTIEEALRHRLVPVIHGDVSFDTVQGCAIISTEQLLVRLTQISTLCPARIVLVGEAGVYTADPRCYPEATRIPFISRHNIANVLQRTGKSHGVDVTGGMRNKIELMWQLVESTPGLVIQLIGPEHGLLTKAIRGTAHEAGTTIALVGAGCS